MRFPLPLLALLAASPALAAEPPGPRAPAANPFEVIGWASLDPVHRDLIRSPSAVDVEAAENETYITVYGKKKKRDVGPRRPGGYEPLDNAALTPRNIPIAPPNGCSRGAYETIGGQAATGQDLVGTLGGGRC